MRREPDPRSSGGGGCLFLALCRGPTGPPTTHAPFCRQQRNVLFSASLSEPVKSSHSDYPNCILQRFINNVLPM